MRNDSDEVNMTIEPLDYDLLEAQQEAQQFWHIAWTMPERMRRTVTLRKVYGYTWEQIARRLGISILEVERELAASAIIFAAHADDDVSPSFLH